MKLINKLLILHLVLAFSSILGIFSKLAAAEPLLSYKFLLFYGIVLLGLFVYAIVWQQLLKKIPLVTAYANKAITVVWGIVWGRLFFDEEITGRKVVGAVVIMVGIIVVIYAEYAKEKDK